MQADLRPILLRRMKEDVETLPEKEEVIVWVELTRQQRTYYKALFTQQVQLVLSNCSTKKNLYRSVPQLGCRLRTYAFKEQQNEPTNHKT